MTLKLRDQLIPCESEWNSCCLLRNSRQFCCWPKYGCLADITVGRLLKWPEIRASIKTISAIRNENVKQSQMAVMSEILLLSILSILTIRGVCMVFFRLKGGRGGSRKKIDVKQTYIFFFVTEAVFCIRVRQYNELPKCEYHYCLVFSVPVLIFSSPLTF